MRLALETDEGTRVGTVSADSASAFIIARNKLARAIRIMDRCTEQVVEPSPGEWEAIQSFAAFAVKLAKYRKAPPPGSRVRDASET